MADPKEEGKTVKHYLSPDCRVLRTGQGVMEYLWLGGTMGQVTVVDIGKNVLHLSDKKINAWLALQQEDTRVDGNQKKEEENGVDLITLDAGDEDEVMLLEERKANEEEDREAKEEAEEACNTNPECKYIENEDCSGTEGYELCTSIEEDSKSCVLVKEGHYLN